MTDTTLMLIDRPSVVIEARSWLGTPFHHQARVKGVGVDCVGLVLGVGKALGAFDPAFDVLGYPRVPDGSSLMQEAESAMLQIPFEEMQPGDVVMIAFGRDPQHVGILGDYRHGGLSIIHASGGDGNDRVIETRLMFSSVMRFVAAFKLPGVL